MFPEKKCINFKNYFNAYYNVTKINILLKNNSLKLEFVINILSIQIS